MTPARYKAERQKRGTQEQVAKALGCSRVTIAKRETGAQGWPISKQAWLALLSLPVKKRQATPQ